MEIESLDQLESQVKMAVALIRELRRQKEELERQNIQLKEHLERRSSELEEVGLLREQNSQFLEKKEEIKAKIEAIVSKVEGRGLEDSSGSVQKLKGSEIAG